MKPLDYHENDGLREDEIRSIVAASFELQEVVRGVLGGMRGPQMRIRCPRGHQLCYVEVEVFETSRGQIVRLTTAGLPRNMTPTAADAAPRFETTCTEDFCEREVAQHSSTCSEGHRQVDVTETLRTRFKCRQCRFDGVYSRERLLKLFAVALHAGLRELRLG